MIWRPKPGMRVELRYGRRWRECPRLARLHGERGAVVTAASGPGPVNALVSLDRGGRVIVPRGNLM